MHLPQDAAGLGDAEDDEGTGRTGNQFRTHLKKSEAASEFSRSKTISQQRRSLPVYTVRDELLQVCWQLAALWHCIVIVVIIVNYIFLVLRQTPHLALHDRK
jgi:hypothetical protein